MAIRKSFVLRGTKQDIIDHLTERHQEHALAAAPDAKGTGKDKHGHDMAAGALQWAIEQLAAWEETVGDDDDDRTSGTNGSEAPDKRRLAAAEAAD